MFRIIEEHSPYSFLVRNEYTGEKHEVSVTASLYHLYDDKRVFAEFSEACPFFRRNDEDGLWYCTVHLTRPDVCRDYGCWRFLILDPEGKRAGRVMGSRHMHAENPLLRSVWDTRVSILQEPDDTIWDRKICEIVRSAGFVIRD
ncbi:MAG: YkgJ family cysteine cluster protein [Methanospirillum sp.]|nr:YkgJ family cysteine cluster protein [Methanospirillum sp.]